MRRADRDACGGCPNQGYRRRCFGREAPKGIEFGDPLAHCFHHAPTASHCSTRHRKRATDDDPIRHLVIRNQPAGHERGGNDAHALLRVVRTVAEAKRAGRDKLKSSK